MASAEFWTAVGAMTTAAAALVAVFQLSLSRKQAKTVFEDDLVAQYREILRDVPVAALLGEALAHPLCDKALGAFYRYVDLCNEQIYLCQVRRLRWKTWNEWRVGIRGNFERPAFASAWEYIDTQIGRNGHKDFDELRRFLGPSDQLCRRCYFWIGWRSTTH